jgi:hypothetical protein
MDELMEGGLQKTKLRTRPSMNPGVGKFLATVGRGEEITQQGACVHPILPSRKGNTSHSRRKIQSNPNWARVIPEERERGIGAHKNVHGRCGEK